MLTLNQEVLQELRAFMDADELGDLLQSAHEQLAQQGALLLQQLEQAEALGAQRLAHRLKGTLGSLGCEDLHDQLHRLETGLRQAPPEWPDPCSVTALKQALAAALQALNEAVQGLPPGG